MSAFFLMPFTQAKLNKVGKQMDAKLVLQLSGDESLVLPNPVSLDAQKRSMSVNVL